MFQPPSQAMALTEKPTLETVRAAISTVLSHDPNVDRKQATDWLEALKNSIFAWEICDQLLLANESIEVSYLAANMLRQKISRNFNELPIECYSSLKDSILNHLQTNEDYAVQGQLTMAIADLTLLLQVWKNPIEDLAKQLCLEVGLLNIASSDHMAIFKALHNRLIFAYVMNQMCDLNHHSAERPCRVGAKRREEFEDYLISKCGQAITWWLATLNEIRELRTKLAADLNNPMTQEPERAILSKNFSTLDKLTGQIYLCYSAWLRIFDEDNVNQSLPLIDSAFKDLNDIECSDNIHQYAVEVVVATANYCDDNRRVDYLINHLVDQVYKLEQAFRQSVAKEDTEKSGNFARTFTSVGEAACLTHVIEKSDFRIVELLLSCLNHYDFEIVEETYAFWWGLLECVQNRLKPNEHKTFASYINRFVMSVTKLCRFDPDEDSVVPIDQEICRFRLNSGEIISNVMFVTSVSDFFRDNSLFKLLEVPLPMISWEETEAILYLVSCLLPMTTREDSDLRRRILCTILVQQTHLPIEVIMHQGVSIKIGLEPSQIHPQMVATSLKIFGALEDLLVHDTKFLEPVLSYILSSIGDPIYRPQLVTYASASLCCILQMNASVHFGSCPKLLNIVKDLCSSLDQFDEQAVRDIMRCSAYLANAIKDVELKDRFICEIIRPNVSSLRKAIYTPSDDVDPLKYSDRLSIILQELNIHSSIIVQLKDFISLVDTEFWAVIVDLLKAHATEKNRSIERTCRTIRYLIRCIKPEWMIQRIAETMIDLYKSYPQNSSPLYICSILVDEFANRSPEINQGLFQMLEIFCTLTFTLLDMSASQSQSLLTMKSYPETIDDMMRLFKRFMKKCPSDFVNCKALQSIIELSISSLRIDHPDANENVSKFMTSFIEIGRRPEYPHITQAIKDVLGAKITDAVIKACLFDIPTSLIGGEAEILQALCCFDKNLFSTWVSATVSTLPKTNIQGIESVTSEQLEDFRTTITAAGSLKRIVNCLRTVARLYS